LMNDLDFNNDADYVNLTNKTLWTAGEGWLPIGDAANSFQGTFNGQHHTVKNLFINRTTANVGFFGNAGNSNISNLALTDINVTGANATGGILGSNSTVNCIVHNCYVTGNIAGGWYTGGIAGTSGDIIASNGCAITMCYSTANITGGWFTGGIVGVGRTSVSNCWSGGTVSNGYNSYCAGISAITDSYGSINNCYSIAVVTSTKLDNSQPSGICSYAPGGTGSNNFWDSQATGVTSSLLGIAKTTSEMKQQSTYSGWDFVDVWQIQENVTYPLLR
jgi:hypothetical protein